MRRGWIVAGALAAAGVSGTLGWPHPTEATEPPSLEELSQMAVAEDVSVAEPAIAALRMHGPAGHAALLLAHAEVIDALRGATGATDADAERVRHAIDLVSGQRDGHASGLYWYTDLGAARAEARQTGRPILSLRLLGNLDEEMSCANSRYFRVVLYSDPEVAAHLRERFVLHWSSERPAPRIEIDMGDGRRMVRTITGNSAHYVLDAEGRPMDAIVGLYSPGHFLAALDEAEQTTTACERATNRASCLARRHSESLDAQRIEWARLNAREPAVPSLIDAVASLPGGGPLGEAPSAAAAMPLTVGKMSIEMPMIRALEGGGANNAPARPTEEPDWTEVARIRGRLGRAMRDTTLHLLRLKMRAGDVDATAERLRETAAADGERNEILFRRRVHEWFRERSPELASFERMNARVYAELMLTPADDPWLGLRADDVYDAIELTTESFSGTAIRRE